MYVVGRVRRDTARQQVGSVLGEGRWVVGGWRLDRGSGWTALTARRRTPRLHSILLGGKQDTGKVGSHLTVRRLGTCCDATQTQVVYECPDQINSPLQTSSTGHLTRVA